MIQDAVSERYNPRYRFDVAFNEPEIIQRTIVTTALGEFVRETERVVDLLADGFFS